MAAPFNGNPLPGQQIDRETGLPLPFVEKMVDIPAANALLGNELTEMTPVDEHSVSTRTYNLTEINSILDAYYFEAFTSMNIEGLPDVLTGIHINYNQQEGIGNATETGEGFSIGTSAALALGLNASASSSLAIQPALSIDIAQPQSVNVPVTKYTFFILGDVTQAAILARLFTIIGTTVSAWPVFRPVSHTLNVQGAQVSINVTANVQQNVSISTNNTTYTKGRGTSVKYDVGGNMQTIQIPPTIHPDLTISNPTRTRSLLATANAGWPSAGTNWPALTQSNTVLTPAIQVGVSPAEFPATIPPSLPTSGLYLYKPQADPAFLGFTRVVATVVNFANIYAS